MESDSEAVGMLLCTGVQQCVQCATCSKKKRQEGGKEPRTDSVCLKRETLEGRQNLLTAITWGH